MIRNKQSSSAAADGLKSDEKAPTGLTATSAETISKRTTRNLFRRSKESKPVSSSSGKQDDESAPNKKPMLSHAPSSTTTTTTDPAFSSAVVSRNDITTKKALAVRAPSTHPFTAGDINDDDDQGPQQRPPPGAYRVGLADYESRISRVGVISSIPTQGHVQENEARVSRRVLEDPDGTMPVRQRRRQQQPIHAELVETVEVGDDAEQDTPPDRPSNTGLSELREKANQNSSRSRVLLIAVALIVLAAIGAGITIAVVLAKRGGDDSSEASVGKITPGALSREDIENEIVLMSPTTTFALNSPGSPQRLAIDWLSGDVFSQDLMMQSQPNQVPKLLQRFALATLYFATQGSNWKSTTKKNWLSATNECIGWSGVICNTDRASQLNLQESRLDGSIPIEVIIFLKDSMMFFNLARNELHGTIPTYVGDMLQLVDLRLFENELTGTIPTEIANLSLIRHLAVNINNLSGTLPPMPNQGQLTWLTVRDNDLLYGSLPNDLRDLVSLEQLFIFGTELSGSVSSTLCDTTLWRGWIDCGQVVCDCCTAFDDVPCP